MHQACLVAVSSMYDKGAVFAYSTPVQRIFVHEPILTWEIGLEHHVKVVIRVLNVGFYSCGAHLEITLYKSFKGI